MSFNARLFVALGSLSMALATMLGAYGAHGLRLHAVPEQLEVWHTANAYHFYHSLGLIAVGFLAQLLPAIRRVRWAGWLLMGGLLLFSGSLYVVVLGAPRWVNFVTPFGGLALMLAWLLAAGALLAKGRNLSSGS